MLLTTAVIAQDSLDTGDDDSYIDPDRTSDLFQPDKRVESPRTYMFGIGYGLHPIIILAPALSAGMYWDPVVIGLEISDSEHIGIWEKERSKPWPFQVKRRNTVFEMVLLGKFLPDGCKGTQISKNMEHYL